MEQAAFNFWSIILQLFMAVGLIYFAWRQTQINKRMKELQDYVAISIIPITNSPGNYELQIMNVGKVNTYLKKFEVGQVSNTFPEEKKRLISVGGNPFYRIPITNFQMGQEMGIKLYLLDEFNNKYVSTGGVIIDPVIATPTQQGEQSTQTSQQAPINISGVPVIIPGNARAWSYKTYRYNWVL